MILSQHMHYTQQKKEQKMGRVKEVFYIKFKLHIVSAEPFLLAPYIFDNDDQLSEQY